MSDQFRNNPDIEKAISMIGEIMRDSKRPILVALDGRSGTGKTTIAREIAERLGGVEIVADNFWAGGSNEEWDRKSPKEKAEMAIDWRRVRTEVLEPLLAGQPAAWHPFNWKTGHGLSDETLHSEPRPLIVLDGAYSTRPELQDITDVRILVEVPSDNDRRKRLREREGEDFMKDWHARWDEAEDYYFTKVRSRDSFDLVIVNY